MPPLLRLQRFAPLVANTLTLLTVRLSTGRSLLFKKSVFANRKPTRPWPKDPQMGTDHLSPMAMPTTRAALSGGSLYDLSLADSIRITGNSDTARDSPEGEAILA
jgi:hypothetical protein